MTIDNGRYVARGWGIPTLGADRPNSDIRRKDQGPTVTLLMSPTRSWARRR